LPETAYTPMVIEKSVCVALKEIADVGFSPSALTSYIRNQFSFIFRRYANQEVEEVEENIALNTGNHYS
jgi:hypothetical protein